MYCYASINLYNNRSEYVIYVNYLSKEMKIGMKKEKISEVSQFEGREYQRWTYEGLMEGEEHENEKIGYIRKKRKEKKRKASPKHHSHPSL